MSEIETGSLIATSGRSSARRTFLAWIFFVSVLSLSAAATKELGPLLQAAEAGDADATRRPSVRSSSPRWKS